MIKIVSTTPPITDCSTTPERNGVSSELSREGVGVMDGEYCMVNAGEVIDGLNITGTLVCTVEEETSTIVNIW